MRDVKGFAFLAVCLVVLAVFVLRVAVPLCDAIAPVGTCQKARK